MTTTIYPETLFSFAIFAAYSGTIPGAPLPLKPYSCNFKSLGKARRGQRLQALLPDSGTQRLGSVTEGPK